MSDDPCTTGSGAGVATSAARRRSVVVAGHRNGEGEARRGLADPDAAVRAAALGALARMGALDERELVDGLRDTSAAVRRRACDIASHRSDHGRPAMAAELRRLVEDPDPLVVESACWALGEHRDQSAVAPLALAATRNPDPRCREAAVAALGAIGDPASLPDLVARLDDRPSVRRRAAVALAAFEDPEADRALRRCLEDRDWQVRQVAEVLLQVEPGEPG